MSFLLANQQSQSRKRTRPFLRSQSSLTPAVPREYVYAWPRLQYQISELDSSRVAEEIIADYGRPM